MESNWCSEHCWIDLDEENLILDENENQTDLKRCVPGSLFY